ncbi:LysR substrate-binding domain-containing protein [Microbulbifer sp. SAOS-129_SWC]|uniref:LysR family transcriptional regulator n=1 Tax=Microbulbifer sp. SAOS-129_SWC TaxID=3145235 RepID=UPI00321667D0
MESRAGYSLDDMRLFCAVARAGSLTRAAQQLAVPVSTLSRRLTRLEQSLGLRLLYRDAHRVMPTGTGQRYLERCGPLLGELDEVSGALYEEKHGASGKLRIAAPINITQQWLGPALNDFLLQYPQIEIDLTLSNRNIDIDEQTIDIAFRVGELENLAWIARPLTDVQFLLCASARRAEWHSLTHPQALAEVPVVLGRPVPVWKLQEEGNGVSFTYTPDTNVRLAVDDLHVACRATVDGVGIGLLPTDIAAPYLEQGALVRVLPRWSGQPRRVHMLYCDRHNQPHRLTLLVDFMLERFSTAAGEPLQRN